MTRNLQGSGMTSPRARERLVQRLRERGITDERVLDAIRTVPRHIFVDEALETHAYDDTALPIGYGQTLSKPYVVARMTELLLRDGPLARVLEVGTGSGYQAAVLARVAERVYGVERLRHFVPQAQARLRLLGLRNVRLCHSDGAAGWPEYAPFDGIVLAAAPAVLPEGLLDQLAVGGRLVVPLGPPGEQILACLRRTPEGFERQDVETASFVPLVQGIS